MSVIQTACEAIVIGLSLCQSGDRPGNLVEPPKPVAVVELFTSEGCSSCPPADALLADLVREHADKADLVALSFHVDYWNNLGWKDPWSSAEATGRQKDYAAALGNGNLYTPQMIVGGVNEFVGSNRPRAVRAIAEALKVAPQVGLRTNLSWEGSGERALRVEVEGEVLGRAGTAAREQVLVALVERGLVSTVTRGENQGKTLSHEDVVRGFRMCVLDDRGRVSESFAVPPDVRTDRASVVVVAQPGPGKAVRGVGVWPVPNLPAPAAKP